MKKVFQNLTRFGSLVLLLISLSSCSNEAIVKLKDMVLGTRPSESSPVDGELADDVGSSKVSLLNSSVPSFPVLDMKRELIATKLNTATSQIDATLSSSWDGRLIITSVGEKRFFNKRQGAQRKGWAASFFFPDRVEPMAADPFANAFSEPMVFSWGPWEFSPDTVKTMKTTPTIYEPILREGSTWRATFCGSPGALKPCVDGTVVGENQLMELSDIQPILREIFGRPDSLGEASWTTKTTAADGTVISTPVYCSDYGYGHRMGSAAMTPQVLQLNGKSLPNPYPSDQAGQYRLNGDYLTYKFYVYGENNYETQTPGRLERCQTPYSYAYRESGQIVVNAKTGVLQPNSFMNQDMAELKDVDNKRIQMMEVSTTIDGRFLVFNVAEARTEQGDLIPDGGYARCTPTSWGLIGTGFIWNPNPHAVTGWSRRYEMSCLYSQLGPESGAKIDGKPAHHFIGLAAKPLRDPSGRIFDPATTGMPGSYPWISLDGSDLLYAAAHGSGVGVDKNGKYIVTTTGMKAGMSIIGASTGYIQRHLDEPNNPDRFDAAKPEPVASKPELATTTRTTITSTGLIPGMWNPANALTNSKYPISQRKLVMPTWVQFIGLEEPYTRQRLYSEVDMSPYLDGRYVLFMEMNEMLIPENDACQPDQIGCDTSYKKYPRRHVDLTRTPDVSGNLRNGTLSGGAWIPPSVRYGIFKDYNAPSGKAVIFPNSGLVTVPGNAIDAMGPNFSIEFFLYSSAGAHRVMVRDGSLKIEKSADHRLQIELKCKGGSTQSLVSEPLFADRWTHVAITVDGSSQSARLYLNGENAPATVTSVNKKSCEEGLVASGQPLLLGPNNSGTLAVQMILDDLKISKIVRPLSDLRLSAHVREKALDENETSLPLGLRLKELKIHSGEIYSKDQARLGAEIFRDKSLSSSENVSCASCHSPTYFFADPKGVSTQLNGSPLALQSPSLLNRVFAMDQGWSGGSASLEIQSTKPFLNPIEMGLTQEQLITKVKTKYGSRFKEHYGIEPENLTLLDIQDSLSRYMRQLVAGESKVDQFEKNKDFGLTEAEQLGYDLFRGKARCVSCHNGTNYSDGQPHRLGFVNLEIESETGRKKVTGREEDLFKFVTPSLRNVSETAPYFHNGSVQTLEAVVDLYNAGAQHDQADPWIRPLGLTSDEKSALVAFLKALVTTDMRGLNGKVLSVKPANEGH